MKKLFLFLLSAVFTFSAFGGVEKMATPWKTPPRRLNLQSYIGSMYYYAANFPDRFRLEKPGESPLGLPVYLAIMTDREVPDTEKHVILLTAFHSEAERSATAGLLAFTEWLMGDSSEAKESLQKNVILMMPLCNPEGFFLQESNMNSKNFDPYAAGRGNRINLDTLQLKNPQDGPEHLAYQTVADRYKPDFHLDVHGIALHFNGQLQPMTLGRAGSNSSLTLWDQKLLLIMKNIGKEKRFGIMEPGIDSQRLIWGSTMGKKQESFCDMGQPYYYCAMYSYFRHHTMLCILESTYNFSVTEPIKALLRQANQGFSSDRIKDFAVNTIKTNYNCSLESYGLTRAERRKSRSSLWQKQQYFAIGSSYPQSSNYMIGVVAYGAEGLKKLTGSIKDSGRWGQVTFADLLNSIANDNAITIPEIKHFISYAPPTVQKIMFEKGVPDKDSAEPNLSEGIAILCTLPTAENEILEIRLNGHPVSESPVDGYECWSENGFTYIRVNIPPERITKEKLFLVTCAWNPKQDIASDYGYLPNPEIKKWIDTKLNDSAGAADLVNAKKIHQNYIESKKKPGR
ncbi:MAG: hypothetical protein LBM70_08095 [Victivallales bacterium]|jgi:hypothetical protein|nr:hypothetical protein [Victivallales bacterium]